MKYVYEPTRDNELLEDLAKEFFDKTYYMLNKQQRQIIKNEHDETYQAYEDDFIERHNRWYR